MSESSVTQSMATGPEWQNKKQHELHVSALLFLRDAESLGDRNSAGQFVLLMHAIELTLKSFLHGQGHSLKILSSKKFGHNLDVLLSEAVERGLAVTDSATLNIIPRLNNYVDKALIRYEIAFEMPLSSDVIRVAHALILDAKPRMA